MPNDLSPSPQRPPRVLKHPRYGPALPDLNWVPAPRYLLRRDLLLPIFRTATPGRILEMGCGAGALLSELAERGYTGLGVDFSENARKLARAFVADHPGMRISDTVSGEAPESFDFLCAFEVLEHIEDDLGALRDWSRYLRGGGTLIISVPAHPERWNPADEWAGHFRRYRRQDLTGMVASAGFRVEDVQCYGFPLANVMERATAGLYARQSAADDREKLDKTGRTGESGTDRKLLTRLWPFYSVFPVPLVMSGFWHWQRRALTSDRGIGYILIARKE